jgi:hypothetical protein
MQFMKGATMNKQITKLALIIMSLTLLMVLGSTTVWAQGGDEVSQDKAENVHQAPKYPIIIDGVRYKPEEVTRFNGQSLIMFANEQVEKEGVIYAFTTEKKAQEYVSSLNVTDSGTSIIPQAHGSRTTIIYKNSNYSTEIDTGDCGESWNLTGSDDNQASSVRAAHCAAGYTKLYNYYNLGGSSLWITMGFDVENLSVYGWNDKASSYKVDL